MYGIRTLLLATVTSLLAWPAALSANETCYEIDLVNVLGPYGVERPTRWMGVTNSGLVSGSFCVYDDCDPFVVAGALYDSQHDTFETFKVPGYRITFAGKANNMGEVAIQACNPKSPRPYDWACRPFVRTAEGDFIQLEAPRGDWTAAMSIDDDRRVGGQWWERQRGRLGLVWDEYGYEVFDASPGNQTIISEVLNDGSIVGTVVSPDWSQSWGFRMEDGMSYLIPPQGTSLIVDGGNNRGQVVGRVVEDGVQKAFLWERGEMRLLDIEGAYDSMAADINDNGTIVGSYDDRWSGFVAYRMVCDK